MEKKYKYMVCTRCRTFNQAQYIEDTMNGFTMQETSFPVVTVIIDDASTDGEQEIIRQYIDEYFEEPFFKDDTEYAHIICSNHRTNPNCCFVVFFLKYNHYSIKKTVTGYYSKWLDSAKYSAICEGDDFWIHPKKLQRQVDFLENHPDHTLCFHAHYSLHKNGTKKECYRYKNDKEVCQMKDLIKGGGGFMATNSMLFYAEMGKRENWPEWAKKSRVGDSPLMFTLAEWGKVGYLCELMSCYRVSTEGSWTRRILMNKRESKEHYKRTFQFWKNYDEWTNYKYHKYIRIKLLKSYLQNNFPFLNRIIRQIKKFFNDVT